MDRGIKAAKMLFKQRNSVGSIVILICLVAFIESAATHKHSGERLEDGAYRPRDAGHIGEDGEHNAEFDHEAILGSSKTAEEFDQLSPDESKRRLRLLVVRMDLNKDEFIDRHELKAHILRSFKLVAKSSQAMARINSLILQLDHCRKRRQTRDLMRPTPITVTS